ncbi:aspartate aminotransferase family protein [Xanthomonas hydrangeae]|uniref:Aspartate aminotransferase family protein n=1 Tax=Xanthomonas hydrangeae TaxID=2775159 RepID=A0AAU0B640_9XANT|nr:aspartate aminotransferase family protein [Xanthomonas hydrangeae]WOB48205.1 aspartate aminotransferase family protein [Xanthomonas hydrangeae]
MNMSSSFAPVTALPHARLFAHPTTDALFDQRSLHVYEDQLRQGLDVVRQAIATADRPFSGIAPDELRARFAGLDLERPLPALSQALAELDTLYLRDAVYFHHPRYAAHLNCPVLNVALLAELVLSALNTSMDTWDQSAGATLIEQQLIAWTAARIGLGAQADGVFTSGGTQSNLMALLLARDSRCARAGHTVKQHGLAADATRLRVFVSQVGHFSVRKACAVLGLGYDAVVPVPCDARQRMDTDALARAIASEQAQGQQPFAVVATAGTTDFGSIDPLPQIAALCRQHGLWMHVDAAYGCGLLVSPRHRGRLSGIEHADSVTVDYHKSFFQPVSCGAFLVRDRAQLAHLTYHADYLNPATHAAEGIPDLVDKSLQTTRRFDALKLWLSLRVVGAEGIGRLFDRVLDLAQQGHALLLAHPCFELAHAPELSTLVFRYRPAGWSASAALDGLNLDIRQRLSRSGEAMIAATRVDGQQYLKFTLLNPQLQHADLEALVTLVRQQGEQLTEEAGKAQATHRPVACAGTRA